MRIDAHSLWQDSDAYVTRARQHLNPPLLRPKNLAGPHDEDEWLRIAFLFPTLPEKSKTDLLIVRRFFLVARKQQELEQTDPDESAEYSEAMADQVAAQLKEALPSFSPVQQEILASYYLILGTG
jgi:hypothetical protein